METAESKVTDDSKLMTKYLIFKTALWTWMYFPSIRNFRSAVSGLSNSFFSDSATVRKSSCSEGSKHINTGAQALKDFRKIVTGMMDNSIRFFLEEFTPYSTNQLSNNRINITEIKFHGLTGRQKNSRDPRHHWMKVLQTLEVVFDSRWGDSQKWVIPKCRQVYKL